MDSNFIPMDSKKIGFRNFDYIIRFAIKNKSEIEKLRSRDPRIFERNRFYEIETLTHDNVNTHDNVLLSPTAVNNTNFGTKIGEAGFRIASANLEPAEIVRTNLANVRFSEINIVFQGDGLTPDPFTWELQSSEDQDFDSMESVFVDLAL